MSIENAILELAGAIRELAASNLKTDDSYRASITAYAQATAAYASGEQVDRVATGGQTVSPEEMNQALLRMEAAKGREQAVQKVKADAKAEKGAPAKKNVQAEPTPEAAAGEIGADDTPLDYKKQVQPVLLKLFKAKGHDALAALLTKHLPGVKEPKGDKLSADQLPTVLAEANALLAG